MPMIADAVRNLPAMGFLPRHPAAHAGGPEATLEHDQSSGNQLSAELGCQYLCAKARTLERSRKRSAALLVVVAAATRVATDIVIEIAVVGELVDVVLLAGRVVRVIVGDVVRFSVPARIVDNAMAAGAPPPLPLLRPMSSMPRSRAILSSLLVLLPPQGDPRPAPAGSYAACGPAALMAHHRADAVHHQRSADHGPRAVAAAVPRNEPPA